MYGPYHGGHETGDAHKDQFIIVQAGSSNDVHNMTLQELTGQAELAAGALVAVKTVVQTGEAVASATTQLKVMEANKTRASQAFNLTKQPTPAEAERKLPDVFEDKKNHEEASNGVGGCLNKHETLQEPAGQAELAADASVDEEQSICGSDLSYPGTPYYRSESEDDQPNKLHPSCDEEQSICGSDLRASETSIYCGSKTLFPIKEVPSFPNFKDLTQVSINHTYGETSDEDPS